MEDITGKQLGLYQVIAPVGEGGMAAVYKAYQPSMDRYVALKILPRHFAADPQFKERFQQEAKVLAKLQHPHILPVFDFGQADDYAFIVMPYVEGGTLVSLMHKQPLPMEQIQKVISQIGDALDYAHTRGLIHRDVKPSNVLIDERENCLLMDFGLAKIVDSALHLTTSGMVMGTPAYMSPEQGLGGKFDSRSDIYSLGVILYEMATGRTPYSAETPMAVIVKLINDPLPPPRLINPVLPETVERVILKALAKNPDDRFATAGEMVKALQAAIAAAPPVSAPVIESQKETPTPLPFFSKPILSIAVGSAVAVLLGLIFSSITRPFLGFLIAGVVNGASIGLAWRRIEPSVSRKQIWGLIVIWALAMESVAVSAFFFLVMGGAAGWFTGKAMQKTQPTLTQKQIIRIALGWNLGWIIGGVLFAIATSVFAQLVAVLFAVLAVMLGGAIGGWIMFSQYRQARG